LRLTTSNPPIGDGRAAAAGRDDDVALAGDGRQRHDAVESEEGDAHAVQVATYSGKQIRYYTGYRVRELACLGSV